VLPDEGESFWGGGASAERRWLVVRGRVKGRFGSNGREGRGGEGAEANVGVG
jgi:hypothetical protein